MIAGLGWVGGAGSLAGWALAIRSSRLAWAAFWLSSSSWGLRKEAGLVLGASRLGLGKGWGVAGAGSSPQPEAAWGGRGTV